MNLLSFILDECRSAREVPCLSLGHVMEKFRRQWCTLKPQEDVRQSLSLDHHPCLRDLRCIWPLPEGKHVFVLEAVPVTLSLEED